MATAAVCAHFTLVYVVCLVTIDTGGRSLEAFILVAGLAQQPGMLVTQFESGGVVIEVRLLPLGRRVTAIAATLQPAAMQVAVTILAGCTCEAEFTGHLALFPVRVIVTLLTGERGVRPL